jgi:hypothetical protein
MWIVHGKLRLELSAKLQSHNEQCSFGLAHNPVLNLITAFLRKKMGHDRDLHLRTNAMHESHVCSSLAEQ